MNNSTSSCTEQEKYGKQEHTKYCKRPGSMIAWKRCVRRVSNQQMHLVADKWARFKYKMLEQQIQTVGKQTGKCYPENQRAAFLENQRFSWLNRSPAPTYRNAPDAQ